MTAIYTVGGSIEPIVESLNHYRPEHVLFIASSRSARLAEDVRARCGHSFSWELLVLEDEQNLGSCVAMLRELAARHPEWAAGSCKDRLLVDFTGGTKVMVAAVAMVFSRMAVDFSYVGGEERTKSGLGVVKGGSERFTRQRNPMM